MCVCAGIVSVAIVNNCLLGVKEDTMFLRKLNPDFQNDVFNMHNIARTNNLMILAITAIIMFST